MDGKLNCLRCGRDMVCWKRNMYLDLEEGMILRVPDWVQMDVYRCPGCGKLEFFQADFSPKAEEHIPVDAEPDDVDTTGYYTRPASDQISGAPFVGRNTRRTTPSAPCAGRGGTSPASGVENGSRQRRRLVHTAGAREGNKCKSGRFGGRFSCVDRAGGGSGGLFRHF